MDIKLLILKKRHQIIPLFYVICILIIPIDSNCQVEKSITVDTVKVLTYNIKGKTATGIHTTAIKGKFVAVSPDLLTQYPLKSFIVLSDCKWKGKYQVMDIMGKRNVKTIDIFYKGKKRHNQVECICKKAN